VHRDELARTQQKMRIEELAERPSGSALTSGLVADTAPTLVPAAGPRRRQYPRPGAVS
jgi:hypothetical protein